MVATNPSPLPFERSSKGSQQLVGIILPRTGSVPASEGGGWRKEGGEGRERMPCSLPDKAVLQKPGKAAGKAPACSDAGIRDGYFC